MRPLAIDFLPTRALRWGPVWLLGAGIATGTARAADPCAEVPGALDQRAPAVIEVDDRRITQEMLDAATRYFPPAQLEAAKTNGQFDRLLDQLALGEVYYQEAVAQGWYADPDVQAVIAMRAREALANEYVYRLASARVTEPAVLEYYRAHPAEFGAQPLEEVRSKVEAAVRKVAIDAINQETRARIHVVKKVPGVLPPPPPATP